MNDCWKGCRWSPPSANPSTVTIRASWCATARVRQLFTRRPSSRTVQAPHCPWSQPFLGPVSPRCSRNASRSVVRVSMTSRCAAPFTRRVISMSIAHVPPSYVLICTCLLRCLWIAVTDNCFPLSKSLSGMRCSFLLCLELFNASNLLLQRGHVLLQFLHVLLQGALVLFKHETAFGKRSGTLAAQLGKTHHLCARHACIP